MAFVKVVLNMALKDRNVLTSNFNNMDLTGIEE